jgi:hypothetical protein
MGLGWKTVRIKEMILSASRRTDIPAFYSKWFMNRIRAGFCETVNPFNFNQKTIVSLKPQDVEAIVFWTRYPAPLFPFLKELEKMGFVFYFQFTVTPYGKDLDKRAISLEKRINSFINFSNKFGNERIIWRYDPIVIASEHTFFYHLNQFQTLCEKLSPYTNRVVVSFLDYYKKTSRNLKLLDEQFIEKPELVEGYGPFMTGMVDIAKTYNLEIQSCAETRDLRPFGIANGHCIDKDLISRLTGKKIDAPKDPNQRKECGCVASKDIGAYNTCIFGCRYCYAVNNHDSALRNRQKIHNSPVFLMPDNST